MSRLNKTPTLRNANKQTAEERRAVRAEERRALSALRRLANTQMWYAQELIDAGDPRGDELYDDASNKIREWVTRKYGPRPADKLTRPKLSIVRPVSVEEPCTHRGSGSGCSNSDGWTCVDATCCVAGDGARHRTGGRPDDR